MARSILVTIGGGTVVVIPPPTVPYPGSSTYPALDLYPMEG